MRTKQRWISLLVGVKFRIWFQVSKSKVSCHRYITCSLYTENAAVQWSKPKPEPEPGFKVKEMKIFWCTAHNGLKLLNSCVIIIMNAINCRLYSHFYTSTTNTLALSRTKGLCVVLLNMRLYYFKWAPQIYFLFNLYL